MEGEQKLNTPPIPATPEESESSDASEYLSSTDTHSTVSPPPLRGPRKPYKRSKKLDEWALDKYQCVFKKCTKKERRKLLREGVRYEKKLKKRAEEKEAQEAAAILENLMDQTPVIKEENILPMENKDAAAFVSADETGAGQDNGFLLSTGISVLHPFASDTEIGNNNNFNIADNYNLPEINEEDILQICPTTQEMEEWKSNSTAVTATTTATATAITTSPATATATTTATLLQPNVVAATSTSESKMMKSFPTKPKIAITTKNATSATESAAGPSDEPTGGLFGNTALGPSGNTAGDASSGWTGDRTGNSAGKVGDNSSANPISATLTTSADSPTKNDENLDVNPTKGSADKSVVKIPKQLKKGDPKKKEKVGKLHPSSVKIKRKPTNLESEIARLVKEQFLPTYDKTLSCMDKLLEAQKFLQEKNPKVENPAVEQSIGKEIPVIIIEEETQKIEKPNLSENVEAEKREEEKRKKKEQESKISEEKTREWVKNKEEKRIPVMINKTEQQQSVSPLAKLHQSFTHQAKDRQVSSSSSVGSSTSSASTQRDRQQPISSNRRVVYRSPRSPNSSLSPRAPPLPPPPPPQKDEIFHHASQKEEKLEEKREEERDRHRQREQWEKDRDERERRKNRRWRDTRDLLLIKIDKTDTDKIFYEMLHDYVRLRHETTFTEKCSKRYNLLTPLTPPPHPPPPRRK